MFNDDSLAGEVFGKDIGAEEDPTANGEDIKPCQLVLFELREVFVKDIVAADNSQDKKPFGKAAL